ncbi:MAG: hypothetical protein N3D11_13270 [Candidatus Sumerlaeia bacterium]|nr:hypothetical protein [Candidatus Sumerlaeia bacterium]
MKARFCLVVLLLCAAIASAGESPTQTVRLTPRWKKGEKLRYEMHKSRQRLEDGKKPLGYGGRTDVDIEVLEARAGGFLIAWTYGESQLDDSRLAGEPMLRAIADIVKGRPILLELDADASLMGVRNWQELRSTFMQALELVLSEMAKAKEDPATIALLRTQLRSMLSTKQQIEILGTMEAGIFFLVPGMEFEGGEPIEVETEIANPFGGSPFPATERFELETVDAKRGVAKVKRVRTAEPEAATRRLGKIVEDMAGKAGKGPRPGDKMPKVLLFEDAGEFVVNLSTGWIESLKHTRTVKMEGGSQVDLISFTRKRP